MTTLARASSEQRQAPTNHHFLYDQQPVLKSMDGNQASPNHAALSDRDRAAWWVTMLALLVVGGSAASHFWLGEPALRVESAPSQQAEFQINLTTAKIGELTLLPGVGPKLGSRIAASRGQSGDFHHWNDLQRVKGIGPKKAAALAPYVMLP